MSLLVFIIALEGIGTLIWFMSHPSETGSRVFLFYSLGRWGLIIFTSILIFFLMYVLWTIRNRPGRVTAVIEYFEDEKRAADLLVAFTIILILALATQIGLLWNEKTQTYYWQILPLPVLLTLSILQVWIFLLVVLRQSKIRVSTIWFPVYQEDRSYLDIPGRRLLVALVGISMAYLTVQINAGLKVPQAIELGDTTSYLEGAGISLSDPAFFSERRPWGILLVYKLLGGSLATIGLAQLAFSTLAWLSLAWMFVGSLRTSIGKTLGLVIVLGLSLSPAVQAWNHAGLSESFSASTLVFLLALFIGLFQRWRLTFFLALIFLFALWVSIHEINLYLGLFTAIALFVVGLQRRSYRTFLILSFCIAIMVAINSHLSSLYALPRWALPVAEVITKRILPVPEYREFFSNQGMPTTPELISLSGRWANSDDYAILNNPRLRPFSKWLFQEGKTVYTRFLISNPIYTLTLPIVNLDEMLAVDFSKLIPGYQPALPAMLNELFFPTRWFWAYLGISVFFLSFIFWKQRRESSRVYWLTLLFFIFSIPYLFLTWHVDALDLARHAAIPNIQFHLGMWLLVVYYLDKKLSSS